MRPVGPTALSASLPMGPPDARGQTRSREQTGPRVFLFLSVSISESISVSQSLTHTLHLSPSFITDLRASTEGQKCWEWGSEGGVWGSEEGTSPSQGGRGPLPSPLQPLRVASTLPTSHSSCRSRKHEGLWGQGLLHPMGRDIPLPRLTPSPLVERSLSPEWR